MGFGVSITSALLMFISPCVLPLLPVYVAFFSGGKTGKLKTLFNALAFCLGISLVFIALFAAFSFFAIQISKYQTEIFAISGIIVVLFGLKTMGYLDLPFLNFSVNVKTKTENLNLVNALVLGLVFSVSMGSCGLGYLFTVVAIPKTSFFHGLLLGGAFTLTIVFLFILCAMLLDQLKGVLRFIQRHYEVINRASGILLVIFGFLLAMGFTQKLSTWVNLGSTSNIIKLVVVVVLVFSLMLSTTGYKAGVESGNRKTSIILLVVGVTGITLFPGIFHLIGTKKHKKQMENNLLENHELKNSDIENLDSKPTDSDN